MCFVQRLIRQAHCRTSDVDSPYHQKRGCCRKGVRYDDRREENYTKGHFFASSFIPKCWKIDSINGSSMASFPFKINSSARMNTNTVAQLMIVTTFFSTLIFVTTSRLYNLVFAHPDLSRYWKRADGIFCLGRRGGGNGLIRKFEFTTVLSLSDAMVLYFE